MNLNETIDNICKLPIYFAVGDKSLLVLIQESGFEKIINYMTPKHVQNYLKNNEYLIDAWKDWSNNKRSTSGYFLKLEEEFSIGYLNNDGKIVSVKTFEDASSACAEFIYREVNSILGTNND